MAGRYIDEGIEKVSSSLIKVKSLHLKPNDCPVKQTCSIGDKCQIVLLSDFGASASDEPYCLQFSYSPDEKQQVDIEKIGGALHVPIQDDLK